MSKGMGIFFQRYINDPTGRNRCWTPLTIREIRMKTSYHLTPSRMATKYQALKRTWRNRTPALKQLESGDAINNHRQHHCSSEQLPTGLERCRTPLWVLNSKWKQDWEHICTSELTTAASFPWTEGGNTPRVQGECSKQRYIDAQQNTPPPQAIAWMNWETPITKRHTCHDSMSTRHPMSANPQREQTAVVPGAAGRRTGRVTALRHRKNPADCLQSNAEWLRWELKSTGCSSGGPGLDSWHLHGSSPPSVAPAPGSHDGFWHNPQAPGIQAAHKHTCRPNSQNMK